ncbi:MAG: hypothetical protein JWM35_1512, partial [Verrucomicrobia bacterium]|nr:hypothetical protein [Verrucomicrobiota bacterium]
PGLRMTGEGARVVPKHSPLHSLTLAAIPYLLFNHTAIGANPRLLQV